MSWRHRESVHAQASAHTGALNDSLQTQTIFGSLWSMAGAHFDRLATTKRLAHPRLQMTAMEQADRKYLLPVPLPA
jgi:hypothetical protein